MTAQIISGKEVAATMREEMKQEVERLKAEHNLTPGLVVILAGENPASMSYVKAKTKACDTMGIYSKEYRLPADCKEEEILDLIKELNEDDKIHGILVQLPLPDHIDESKILNTILPSKDVDGFHPVNVGKLMIGEPEFLPCTPFGIQQLLIRSGIDPEGKDVVIVGRSNIVGKPVAMILMQKKPGANSTVTVCHSRTKDLAAHTRRADILIAAMGRAEFITADMVKEGAVVIDVGVNRVEDATRKRGYRLVGDVKFDEVKEKASYITPVPGGVGPMTITMLLYNTISAAKKSAGLE